MKPPHNNEEEELNPEVLSAVEKSLENEPEPGDSISDLNPKDQEALLATKRRIIKPHDLLYRVLYPQDGPELVLIIPPNISIALARKGLADLKTLSSQLHNGIPEDLTLGAKIFLEYQILSGEYHWTETEICEQVTFDLLVTWSMMQHEEEGSTLYRYAEMMQSALLEFVRMPRSKQKGEFADNLERAGVFGILPFTPQIGFTQDKEQSNRKIKDAFKAWEKDFKYLEPQEEFYGVLACFWAVSYLSHYWDKLGQEVELSGYNKSRRNKLINKFMQGIVANFPDFASAGPLSDELLTQFLKQIW